MFEAVALVVVVAALLVLYRAFAGPTVFDRALATNLFGTKTVILLAVIGFIDGRPHFLDLALVYALINFIVTVAILRYIETGGLE